MPMLAALELESPIPEEAFLAVAEILSHVYKANGQKDPFDAIVNPPVENESHENHEGRYNKVGKAPPEEET